MRGKNMTGNDDYLSSRKTAFVLQAEGIRRTALEALVRSCDLNLLPSFEGDSVFQHGHITPIRAPDYLLSDLQSEPDLISTALEAISQYLNEHGTELLVWVSQEQVDPVYAALPGNNVHILCNAQDFEAIPILTGALKPMKMQGLRQDDVQTDYRALHRISDELADFARTLARIAEQDDPAPNTLNDKPVSFRPAPAAIFDSLTKHFETMPKAPDSGATKVRTMLKLRRKRENYFNATLFADPAWDILLDLYAAELEGQKVSVSSLCIAASVPPTTGLRWIGAMTADGLLQREHDPEDARRIFIRLSETAREALSSYFTDMGIDISLSI